MVSEVVDLFEPSISASPIPDPETVEDLLLQAMEEEFECEVDDGSPPMVAREIVNLWKAIGSGEGEAAVVKIEGVGMRAGKTGVQVKKGTDVDDQEWEDEDEEMDESEHEEEEVPTLQPRAKQSDEPEVDEDGFTVVKAKGRR